MSAARPPSGPTSPAAVTPFTTGGPGSDDRRGVEPDEGPARAPSVPGFVCGRLLGRGGSASVWLATDSAGRRFALKVSHAPLRPQQQPDDEPSVRAQRPSGSMPGRRARRTTSFHGSERGPDAPGSGDEQRPGPAADPAAGPGRGIDARGAAGEDVLHRELRLLQHLRHEHLVRVHRVIETEQGPALLMDLAVGGSLLDLVRSRGPLPIAEVVTTLAPVAQALGYLHEAGALHGDITPGNILFTHEGKPLLSDFGTGRLLGSAPVAMPGTPGFTDPASTTAYDAGVDIFALAAVSWFALTGRVPGPSEQRPPLSLIVPEVPDDLMHLIEDGLSSTRERRPSAASFARTLLSTSSPVPVNLVPAVHASVLPELLTRRSESRPTGATSRWSRLMAHGGVGRRAAAAPARGGDVRREPGGRRSPQRGPARQFRQDSGLRSRDDPPRASSTDIRAASGTYLGDRPERTGEAPRRTAHDGIAVRSEKGRNRVRRVLAVVSGSTAVVLLAMGITLATGGLRAPHQVSSGPEVQGEEVGAQKAGVQAPSDDSGTSITDDGSASGEPQAHSPAVEQPSSRRPASAEGGASGEAAIGAEEPVAVLQGLVDLRASAFGAADPGILQEVDVAGSPAMIADRRSVDALEQTGSGLRDLSIAVREARVLTDSALSGEPSVASLPGLVEHPDDVEAVAVRATMHISSYTIGSPPAEDAGAGELAQDGKDGPEAGPPPLMAAGQQELVIVLWNTEQGWRIHSVVEPW